MKRTEQWSRFDAADGLATEATWLPICRQLLKMVIRRC